MAGKIDPAAATSAHRAHAIWRSAGFTTKRTPDAAKPLKKLPVNIIAARTDGNKYLRKIMYEDVTGGEDLRGSSRIAFIGNLRQSWFGTNIDFPAVESEIAQ